MPHFSHIPSSPIHPTSLVFTPFSFPACSKYRPGPPHIGTNTSLLLFITFPVLTLHYAHFVYAAYASTTLEMEEESLSEMLVPLEQCTLCHI